MIKLIALTSQADVTFHVNTAHIGYFYRCLEREGLTKITVLTHNNGGFYVKETPEEIIKLIEKS